MPRAFSVARSSGDACVANNAPATAPIANTASSEAHTMPRRRLVADGRSGSARSPATVPPRRGRPSSHAPLSSIAVARANPAATSGRARPKAAALPARAVRRSWRGQRREVAQRPPLAGGWVSAPRARLDPVKADRADAVRHACSPAPPGPAEASWFLGRLRRPPSGRGQPESAQRPLASTGEEAIDRPWPETEMSQAELQPAHRGGAVLGAIARPAAEHTGGEEGGLQSTALLGLLAGRTGGVTGEAGGGEPQQQRDRRQRRDQERPGR